MDTKNLKLAENIRFYRKEKSLTQDELAAIFQSRRTLISNYENGISIPDILRIWELADFFDVSIDELIGREYKNNK